MATRSIITNKGMELLAASSTLMGNFYWLGYYALAYVPNFWKDDDGDNLIDIPNCPDQMVNPTGLDPLIGPNTIVPADVDKLNSNMTRLTENGDMIWNVFQGDLVGPGFLDGISDGSTAGDLYGLTLYSANVKKHYRYVLDENGNNNLVAWIIDPTNVDLMLGAYRYRGTDGFTTSGMPIPAPLYYFGDASKDNTIENPPFSITQYINDFALDTGFDVYPYIDVPVSPTLQTFLGGDSELSIPRVSADYRGYLDSTGTDTNSPVTHGTYFDSNEIPAANININNVNGWFDSASSNLGLTRAYLDEFYNLISVSNYNRYHSPVGELGNILNSDLKNRNMAKVSKLFPIFDFSVINSQRGTSNSGDTREVATGISLTIDLDIAPLLRTQGYTNVDPSTGTGIYDQESDLTLQDRYNNVNNNSTPNAEDIPLFNSTKTSFKFNRIGIYAIPVRKAPNTQDPLTQGNDVRFDVEIDPDAEPVLFAVIDWDNTQHLSDTGDGAHQFRAQFNVNLESPDGVEETPLIRDTAVFYNLYNNNALNWYKNQLLANASTQHAIIELQQEISNLKLALSKSSVSSCCDTSSGSGSGGGAVIASGGLRNLLDSATPEKGGLRGIDTMEEGDDLIGNPYVQGFRSVTLGNNTAAEDDDSFVTGVNNRVRGGLYVSSVILGGSSNDISGANQIGILASSGSMVQQNSDNSVILGGFFNVVVNSNGSNILGGTSNYILSTTQGSYNTIIAGYVNTITDSDLRTPFPVEYTNQGVIIGSDHSNIMDGAHNVSIISSSYATLKTFFNAQTEQSVILASNNVTIENFSVDTKHNVIMGTTFSSISDSANSTIIGAFGDITQCYINNSSGSAIISARATQVGSSSGSVVIGGGEHLLSSTNNSIILGGVGNSILNLSNRAATIGGEGLATMADNQVVIGKFNVDDFNADFLIGGGVDNSNRLNNFALTTYKSGIHTDHQSIYVRYLISDTEWAGSVPSGVVYADFTSGVDANGGYLLRWKP